MIVGSVAAMVYDEPRTTHDMGLELDTLLSELNHRKQFDLIHQETRGKIDNMTRKNTSQTFMGFSLNLNLIKNIYKNGFRIFNSIWSRERSRSFLSSQES